MLDKAQRAFPSTSPPACSFKHGGRARAKLDLPGFNASPTVGRGVPNVATWPTDLGLVAEESLVPRQQRAYVTLMGREASHGIMLKS